MGALQEVVRAAAIGSGGWLALTGLSRLIPLVRAKPMSGEMELPWAADRVFELLADPLLDAWSTGAEGVTELVRSETREGGERVVMVVHDLLGVVDRNFATTWIIERSARRLRELRDAPDQSTQAVYEVQPVGEEDCNLRWLIESSRRPLVSPRAKEVDWTTVWPAVLAARNRAPAAAQLRAELRQARRQAFVMQRGGELLVTGAIGFAISRSLAASIAFAMSVLLVHRITRWLGDRRRLDRHLRGAGVTRASLRTPSTT